MDSPARAFTITSARPTEGETRAGILAAIACVADSYDAMTSNRAYRDALGKEKAIEELKKYRGTQFHPDVVDAFLEILEIFMIGI